MCHSTKYCTPISVSDRMNNKLFLFYCSSQDCNYKTKTIKNNSVLPNLDLIRIYLVLSATITVVLLLRTHARIHFGFHSPNLHLVECLDSYLSNSSSSEQFPRPIFLHAVRPNTTNLNKFFSNLNFPQVSFPPILLSGKYF